MHKDDGIEPWQHQIGLPGDVLGVKPVAKALRVQETPEDKFRLRVLASDPGHHSGAGLAIDDVGHLSPGLGLWTWYTAIGP
jgi:hypothetical protein